MAHSPAEISTERDVEIGSGHRNGRVSQSMDFSTRDANDTVARSDGDEEITLSKLQAFRKEVLQDFGYLWQRGMLLWNKLTWNVLWLFFVDRVPIIEWMPRYSTQKFLKDLQAGLVVGCMLIPQGMGYADVAGLPFVAGLYSGFAPLILYFVFGTSRQVTKTNRGTSAWLLLLSYGHSNACGGLSPVHLLADGNRTRCHSFVTGGAGCARLQQNVRRLVFHCMIQWQGRVLGF